MAKDYYLDNYGNDSGAPPKFISDKAMLRKSTAELRGICKAFLLDGVVTIDEANLLKSWINDHPVIVRDPLAAALVKRVARIYSDGVVTPEELVELKDFLTHYTGEDFRPSCMVFNDPPPEVLIKGKAFCFTGSFVCGSRDWCKDQIINRGGLPLDRVGNGLDYLVVGGIASPAWANMNYGTKIEKAMEMRSNPWSKLAIIKEEYWLTRLQA